MAPSAWAARALDHGVRAPVRRPGEHGAAAQPHADRTGGGRSDRLCAFGEQAGFTVRVESVICMLGADELYARTAAKPEVVLGFKVSSTAVGVRAPFCCAGHGTARNRGLEAAVQHPGG